MFALLALMLAAGLMAVRLTLGLLLAFATIPILLATFVVLTVHVPALR